MSTIQWTDDVWNPVLGCSRVSAGCERCYAERFAHRGLTPRHRGLTVLGAHGPRWTGQVRLVPEVLDTPLRWRKPRKVFVNSMSDLFHEKVPFEFVAAVFAVMAATPQHTYQVLTKRPERMREFCAGAPSLIEMAGAADEAISKATGMSSQMAGRLYGHFDNELAHTDVPWPLPNVWLGVSVENQATADARIPLLLECPAAVRWVSAEPLLEEVVFGNVPGFNKAGTAGREMLQNLWIVVGGESGPGARPYDVAWARSIIAQCRIANVPVFHKQMGSDPRSRLGRDQRLPLTGAGWDDGSRALSFDTKLRLRDRNGGDMSEWPEDLRVRDFPRSFAA